jgi:soluble lytic murein transglycosylase-like protein
MDPIDAQIAALEAEIAKEQAALATPAPVAAAEPSGYGLRQLAFDVPTGVARAGAGLADVLSYPVVKGLEYAGAPVETFGLSKLLSAGAEAAAPTLGVRPETEAQELISFLTPSPLSKAKLLGQAGTGLAAYLGSEAGQAIAPESQYAGLVGALLGPSAASTTARVAKGVVNKVAPTVGLIAGSDKALRNAAQAEVLAAAGEEGAARLKLAQSLSNLSEGTGGVPLTATEIAQFPSLAKYQQAIRQTQEGGNVLTPAIEARQSELAAALGRFGVEPQQGDFALALQETAGQAATSKAAKETSMLQTLGLTEQIKAATPTERSKLLRDAIMERKDVADDLAEQAWKAVSGDTKLDISNSLKATIDDFANFGELAKADIGEKAKRVIRKVEDVFANQNGIATVDELQDIRSAAGRAMAEASGTNPRQASLMAALRENLDTAGIKYFYDQVGSIKGLPGAITAKTDFNALEKLSAAIETTRESKQLFSQGVVGEITAIRQFKPKLATSKVIDRAVANPENAEEILSKFGKDSVEATTVRTELLSRIDAAKNPTDFIGKNKQILKTVFGEEYDTLAKYAQSKGRGAPFEEFTKVTDTAIPNKIFADTAQAKKFATAFKDTELFQYARSKFINTKLTKSGDPLANLAKNKKIAEVYFPGDLADLEAVLKDMQLAKSPQQLAAAATKGQSWTSQMTTTLGAIMSARGLVGAMKKGTVTGGLVGLGAGPIGSAAGFIAGYIASRIGSTRESQLNELAAQFLANPSLLKFAKAPPTEQNVKTLLNRAAEMGYLGSKAAQESALEPAAPEQTTSAKIDIDAQIEAVTKEIEALQSESTPAKETVAVGKQNISIPTGKEFAPPSLVKAVMKVESGGKQEAVSPKGARGLMQLMPATARQLGVDPKDPQQNVEGGSKYLQQLLNKYGKKDITLAAYNWGPGNVDKAIRAVKADGKRVTWANIMQTVKVPMETRLYVNKVLTNEREA